MHRNESINQDYAVVQVHAHNRIAKLELNGTTTYRFQLYETPEYHHQWWLYHRRLNLFPPVQPLTECTELCKCMYKQIH